MAASSEVLAFGGRVVSGDGRGRTIGVPTANLQVDENVLAALPRGVHAAQVGWDDEEHRGVVNIGGRPTVSRTMAVNVEVHVLDFDGDLYGRTLSVRLTHRLRDEQRFDSVEELARQIAKDIERARLLTEDGAQA